MKPFDARVMLACLVFFSLAIATIHLPWLIIAMVICAYPWESKTERNFGDDDRGTFIYTIPMTCMSFAVVGCLVRGVSQAYWLTEASPDPLHMNLPLSVEELFFVPLSVVTLRVVFAVLIYFAGSWVDAVRRNRRRSRFV